MPIESDKKEQAKCDAWNAKYAIGTRVKLNRDIGTPFITRTRSKAEVLSGHTAVIWLDGVRGCYDLDRVTFEGAICLSCGAKNVDAAAHPC